MDIIIIISLIILNGLFSMSEIALISVRKSYLASEVQRGSLMARTALKLANDPDKFLSELMKRGARIHQTETIKSMFTLPA